jgi:hypothetical protein
MAKLHDREQLAQAPAAHRLRVGAAFERVRRPHTEGDQCRINRAEQAKRQPDRRGRADVHARDHAAEVAVHQFGKQGQPEPGQQQADGRRQQRHQQRLRHKQQCQPRGGGTQGLAHADLAPTPDDADRREVDVVDRGQGQHQQGDGHQSGDDPGVAAIDLRREAVGGHLAVEVRVAQGR